MTITGDPDIVLSTKRRFADRFLALEKVHGVGVAYKRRAGAATRTPCLVVTVEKKLPLRSIKPEQRIPARVPAFDVAGNPIPGVEVAVDVIAGGPYLFAAVNTAKVRPLVPGYSFGKLGGYAGTIGAKLIDLNLVPGVPKRDPREADPNCFFDPREVRLPKDSPLFFLTCAHVFTMHPTPGDQAIQPGAVDGGVGPSVGFPVRWTVVPQQSFTSTSPGGTPTADSLSYEDAAVIELDRDVRPGITAAIKDVGPPVGQRNLTFLDLEPGKPPVTVQKSGRTTGLTKAVVMATSYDVAIGLGGFIGLFFSVLLRDQILATGPGTVAEGGDSGALVLDEGRMATGLLVGAAGSDMIFTPIMRVMLAINFPGTITTGPAGQPQRYFVLAGS
ncbi:MAG: hypothetical protein IT534_07165 [Bauldia sp.]|nr:hypothetical protein [Bauldia sp.]